MVPPKGLPVRKRVFRLNKNQEIAYTNTKFLLCELLNAIKQLFPHLLVFPEGIPQPLGWL